MIVLALVNKMLAQVKEDPASVLALYNGSTTGGTAYTVKYAYQRNKEIIVIDPTTMERRVIPSRLRCE